MGPNITAEPADDALKMALARRNPPEGCVRHSDHGSQYASLLLSKTIRENGIRPSMGSISSPRDNAAMESLMGIVKSECVHARTYATREEAGTRSSASRSRSTSSPFDHACSRGEAFRCGRCVSRLKRFFTEPVHTPRWLSYMIG